MRLLMTHLAELVLADVLDMAARGIEAQPANAVDIADAKGPFPIEDVGMRIRNGHQHLGQSGVGTAGGHLAVVPPVLPSAIMPKALSNANQPALPTLRRPLHRRG